MTSPFKSVAQRLRSWFTPRKPRTFQHRNRLRVEQMEDRVVPATIAYTSGHTLNSGALAAVGLTVTPNVNGYSADNAGFAAALASGAQALVIGESVSSGAGLNAATKANIASY